MLCFYFVNPNDHRTTVPVRIALSYQLLIAEKLIRTSLGSQLFITEQKDKEMKYQFISLSIHYPKKDSI